MSGYSPVIVAKAQETRTQWAWHLGALALLVGLILLFFQFEVFNAVEVWWIYPTYSHCFLIIPIAAWLVWQMRHDLGASMPAIAPKALLAIPPLLLLWLLGKLATINEVRQFAVIGLIEVAILTMLGARLYRAILFPALYLFFLVPFGQYFIPPMQLFATWFTDAGLNLLGVPHYTEGTVIELTTGRFEVAEACAGLRFLIATIALGVLFAHLTYRKWYKIVTFLPACIIIPLIGNGLRCLGIIMLAYLTNNEVAVGADHLVYGWLFNMAILLVLFFFGTRFRDPAAEPTKVVDNNVQAVSRFSVLMLATATALTIGAGPAFAYWRESRPIFVNSQALTQPFTLGGWTVAQLPGPWHPIYEGADQEFFASFVPGSSRVRAVDLAIEYYGRMRERHSLIASTNRLWDIDTWHQVEAHTAGTQLGSETLQFDETIIASPSEKRLVWSSYWMDGRFTTSGLTIKALQLQSVFTGNEAAALIALSTPIDGAVEDARIRLKTAVTALTHLPNHLVDAGRAQQAVKPTD